MIKTFKDFLKENKIKLKDYNFVCAIPTIRFEDGKQIIDKLDVTFESKKRRESYSGEEW